MMIYNKEWVYRNIHGYNILINILNNNILAISPVVAGIFIALEDKKDDINSIIINWKLENCIADDEKMKSIVDYFISKGVFVDE